MKIQWKKIKECPRYSVSNTGKVKNDETGIQLTPGKTTPGYLSAHLYYGNQRRLVRSVHRLVAEAFIPNLNNCPCVNHLDGNKLNNVVDNLEWTSYAKNNKHALANELRHTVKGVKHPKSKLTENDVLELRSRYATGKYTFATLGRIYGVSYQTVQGIINKKYWKHL